MLPTDVPTTETLTLLEPSLPPAPARILEVGCGSGEVAEA